MKSQALQVEYLRSRLNQKCRLVVGSSDVHCGPWWSGQLPQHPADRAYTLTSGDRACDAQPLPCRSGGFDSSDFLHSLHLWATTGGCWHLAGTDTDTAGPANVQARVCVVPA